VYDPKAAGGTGGGTLYECEPSPPMVAVDNEHNCWVVQDRTPAVMKGTLPPSGGTNGASTGVTEQIPVPLGTDCGLHMTGPCVASS
jgi:hypothetical protein